MDSTYLVTCRCGQTRQAKSSSAGRRARCPNCQEIMVLPPLPVPSVKPLDVGRPLALAADWKALLASFFQPAVLAVLGAAVMAGLWLMGAKPIVSAPAEVSPGRHSEMVGSVRTAQPSPPPDMSARRSDSPEKPPLSFSTGGANFVRGLSAFLPPPGKGVPDHHREGDLLPLNCAGAVGVKSVLFDPEGKTAIVVFAYEHGVGITQWDVGRGKMHVKPFVMNLGADQSWSLSPSGRELVCAQSGRNPALQMFDIQEDIDGTRHVGLSGSRNLEYEAISPASWLPGERRLVAGLHTGKVVMWDPATTKIPMEVDQGKRVTRVAVSPEGTYLLSADLSGEVRIWDLPKEGRYAASYFQHLDPIQLLETRRVGETVMVLSLSGRVGKPWSLQLWDLATQQQKYHRPLPGQIACAAVSDDWRRVALGHVGGAVSVWDVPGEREWERTKVHQGDVTTVAISRDGNLVLSGCASSPQRSDVTARLRGVRRTSSELELR